MIVYTPFKEFEKMFPAGAPYRHGQTIRTAKGAVFCCVGSQHQAEPVFTPAQLAYGGNTALNYWINESTPTRKPMKPGSYESSTHGDILLSELARMLLAAERDAAYISQLENFSINGGPFERRRYLDECRKKDAETAPELNKMSAPIYGDFIQPQSLNKETPMTDQKKEPAPKTRSATLSDATAELCDAQRHLECVQSAPDGVPIGVAVSTAPYNPMTNEIGNLVKEQWAALAKKVVARAKARVAKAEKAVSVLLM